MNNEEEILKECNLLFVTMANVHVNGKPMADLLKLYKQTKEELDKLKKVEEEHQKENGNLRIEIKRLEEQNYLQKEKIEDAIKEWDKSIMWNNANDYYFAIKALKNLLN